MNGARTGGDFRVGATVYYECGAGYRLQGPGSRQCQAHGVWTGRLPECVAENNSCKFKCNQLYVVTRS